MSLAVVPMICFGFAQEAQAKPTSGFGAALGFPSFVAISGQAYLGDLNLERNLTPIAHVLIVDGKVKYTVSRIGGNALHVFGELVTGSLDASLSSTVIPGAGFGLTTPMLGSFGNNIFTTYDIGLLFVPGYGFQYSFMWAGHYRL